jgi:hypothetical protein
MDDRIDACAALKAGESQTTKGWVSVRLLGVAGAALSRAAVLVADRGVLAVTRLTARSAVAVVPCTKRDAACVQFESGRVQRDPYLETGRMRYAVIPGPIAAQGQVPVLDDQSFERWRDYVRPQAKEECYLEIPWRESFYIAINEARKTDRPILLWAMNGHPLGCT